jgi:hypothetical protein
MSGEVERHPISQRAQLCRRAVTQHRGDPDVFAKQPLLDGERADVERILEPLRDRIDVGGIDLHSAPVDLLALASTKVEPASLVDETDVARAKPASGHDCRRQIVAAEIAAHQGGRANPDVAALARRARLPVQPAVGGTHDLALAAPRPSDESVFGRGVFE